MMETMQLRAELFRQMNPMLDSDVLVSALMTRRVDSPTVALLDYVVDGRIVLLFNEEI